VKKPLFWAWVLAGAACTSAGTARSRAPGDDFPMSDPAEYRSKELSAEAGGFYFGRAGAGDPYATGMAYPVFLALMEAYPDQLGRDWNEFAQRFGFIPDPAAKGSPAAVPVGFHLTPDPDTGVPWLVGNCEMCHAERLRLESGDVVVPGLGNTRARPHAYANALFRIARSGTLDARRLEALATDRAEAWHVPWPIAMRGPVVRATLDGLKALGAARGPGSARFEVALPGRVATIESFALAMEPYRHRPVETGKAVGWAKIPDIVGFPYRETFSYDASGFGAPSALVAEANFLFGARPRWYLSHPGIATSMYLYLQGFHRTLRYPGRLDASLATQGKAMFAAKCSGCHGLYEERDGEQWVSYRERVVPIDTVGTDRARLDAVTPDFVDAANALPFGQGYVQTRKTNGYVPPVLLNVWARGLLGHAGQWPSIEVLATPPQERPVKFIVDTEGPYDVARLGVRYERVVAPRPLRAGEYLYDGEGPGYGVGGHPFLSRLGAADRRAVVEYLKTL